jgi:DNA polymerase III subunit gamma/tau
VKLEPGRIDINLADGAPKTLAGDLSKRLQDWTGQRWMVSVSAQKLGQTLEETANQRRDGLMADAKADPDVAAILARFPGAKIIDVKILGAPEAVGSAETELPVLENAAPDDDFDDN